MSPGTFSRIYIQLVFEVQGRKNLIPPSCKEELHEYISGIITNQGQKLIAINSVPDHIHIFIGMKPTIALCDLVRDIKNSSSPFVSDNKWVKGKFHWQEGYGAFSYGHSQIDRVVKYIQSQEFRHKRKTFREEYLEFLKKFEIEYDEKYLFEWIE